MKGDDVMKLIGFSEGDREPIVMLTRVEYHALKLLQEAGAGEKFPMWMPDNDHPQHDGEDISSALKAIREWVVLKFKVNEMRQQIDMLEGVLDETS